jgi:hypothetical protein
VIIEEKKGIASGSLSTFLSSSLNIELVYVILAGITRFSSFSIPEDDRPSINSHNEEESENSVSFITQQKINLMKVEALDHVRDLTLNKIRINNAN